RTERTAERTLQPCAVRTPRRGSARLLRKEAGHLISITFVPATDAPHPRAVQIAEPVAVQLDERCPHGKPADADAPVAQRRVREPQQHERSEGNAEPPR